MATKIVVPDAGQTTDELLLAKWHVDVGDEVDAGDFLADIETDKAVAELESFAGGTVLKLMAEEGDTILTGQTLLWLGEEGEEIPEEEDAPAQDDAAARSEVVETPSPTTPGMRATPAARTLAREQGVALTDLAGSGPDGCIVKRDVEGMGGGESVELSSMRKAIAARLQQSVREAPHFYVAMDVDMTKALAAKEAAPTKISINDLIVKAAAGALRDVPQVNCRLDGDTVRYLTDINIGIAVGVDEGLVVPVLVGADSLSLAEVAERSRELVASAREGRLAAGAQSTFTVSNLGMYGVKSFSAIINPPEAAILAVGAIEDRVVLTDAGIAAVPTLTLTLSSDHRVVDGTLAARLLNAVRERLETPREEPEIE
ncbi:MAG TPA: dihydrolipoamide acetyltransferase family protein [Armatimonadota bacterium]|nr:dihydrolipoamide acetyltransferase family protein [Armatimonadota bacterium]